MAMWAFGMRFLVALLTGSLLLAVGEAAAATRYRRPPAAYRARPAPPPPPYVQPYVYPYVQPYVYDNGGYSNPYANRGGLGGHGDNR
jgi:hypothetical protein